LTISINMLCNNDLVTSLLGKSSEQRLRIIGQFNLNSSNVTIQSELHPLKPKHDINQRKNNIQSHVTKHIFILFKIRLKLKVYGKNVELKHYETHFIYFR